MAAVVGIDEAVKTRLPLAAAIVLVLAAGATVALVRPGDLDDGDTAAVGAPSSSTTTTGAVDPAPGADPGSEPESPAAPTTTPTTTTATERAPSPTTPAPTPTSRPAPAPPGGSDTTVSGGAGVASPPRLADTGSSGRLTALGLGLVLAGVAACWSASRSHARS